MGQLGCVSFAFVVLYVFSCWDIAFSAFLLLLHLCGALFLCFVLYLFCFLPMYVLWLFGLPFVLFFWSLYSLADLFYTNLQS